MKVQDNLRLFSNRVIISESSDSDNLRAKFVLCDFGVNKNGVLLNRETVESWISSIINQPLVGKIVRSAFTGKEDFSSHNMKIVLKPTEDGSIKKVAEFDTDAFGTFVECAIETIDGVECITATAEVWRRFERACNLIVSRAEAGTLHSSWEISVSESHMNGTVKVIDSGKFFGHCILAESVAPAYDSSRLLEVAEESFDMELADALSEDIRSASLENIEQEELIMQEEKIPVAEVLEEVSTDTPVSETVETEEEVVESKCGDDEEKKEKSEEEVESSALTEWDLRQKLQNAAALKLNTRWCWIAWHFPIDKTIWVEVDGRASETDYVKEKYQDQWWAYEEAHYDWLKKQWEKARDERVKLLEEERDALLDAKEKEREAEEKAAKEEYEAKKIHEDTIDLLEKEIDAYEEKVNRQKELLDRQSDARSHEQDVAESNKIIADLNAQLEEIKNDDSAKAAAKRAEIQEKLNEEIKRLEDKQYDWSVNKQKESLDDELDNYKKHHDKLIEEQEKLLDDLEKSYDATIESIKNKFEGLIDSLKEQFEQLINFQKEQEYATRPMPPATVEPIDSGKPSSGDDKYTIRKGDTLSKIAREHGTTVTELLRLNPEITDPNLIRAGRTLKLYHSGGVVTKKNQEDFDTITDLKPDETVAKLQVGEGVLTADQMAAAADRIKLYNKFRDFISGSDYIAKSMPNAIANAGSAMTAGTNIVNNNTPSIVMNNEIHLANTDNDSMNKLKTWGDNLIDTAVKEMSKKFVGSVAFGSGLKIKPV